MVGRVLPFLAYGWISQVAINNRGNKAYVLIQKQSHLFFYESVQNLIELFFSYARIYIIIHYI